MSLIACLVAAVGLSDPSLAWEVRPGFRDFGRIVVAGEVLVTGNVTGTGGTFAFSAATGKRLWRAPGVLISGPVTDGRVAYSVNVGAGLTAFDLKSGRVLWRVPDVAGDPRANLLADGGRVYVADERGALRAYEASSGTLLWEHGASAGVGRGACATTPVVVDGVLYYGRGTFLWALDASSGKELWRFAAKPDPSAPHGRCVTAPAAADGIVVVTSEHVIFGIDARSGAERWRDAVVRRVRGAPSLRVLSPAVVDGGRAYAIVEDALIGWDVRSGRRASEFSGQFPTESRIRNLVPAGGLLYFTANFEQPQEKVNRQGFLYALDPLAGQVRWKHRVNRDVQYVEHWGTNFFTVAGGDVYYENHALLAKVRP